MKDRFQIYARNVFAYLHSDASVHLSSDEKDDAFFAAGVCSIPVRVYAERIIAGEDPGVFEADAFPAIASILSMPVSVACKERLLKVYIQHELETAFLPDMVRVCPVSCFIID